MPGPDDLDPLHDLLLRGVPIVEGYKVLGRCVLLARVGAGAMGVVYRAWHLKFAREVAVKVMRPSLAGDPAFVARFEREAQLSMVVSHDHVVRVHDVGFTAGLYHLVMEFVDGETVTQRVQRWGRMRQAEAVTVLQAVAAGLAEAHARGIVHRDIKPDNFLVARTGRVKLADLGLATTGEDGGGEAASAVRVGTPQYRAPEQWATADVQPSADVWALGAVLYFLLTGEHGVPPKSGDWILHHDFPSLRARRPELRPELHALFERCVPRDPAARFPDAGALHAALVALGLQDEALLRLGDATGTAAAAPASRVPSAAVLGRLARAVLGPGAAPALPTANAATSAPAAVAVAPTAAVRMRPVRRAASPWPLLGLLAVAAVVGFVVLRSPGAVPAGGGDATLHAAAAAQLAAALRDRVEPAADVSAPATKVVVGIESPPPGLRRLRAVLVPADIGASSPFPSGSGIDCGPGAWRGTLTGAQDGAYLVRMLAVGNDGIEVELPPRRVVLDVTPPAVGLRAPARLAVVPARCELVLDVAPDAVRVELAARTPPGDAGTFVVPWRAVARGDGGFRTQLDLPAGAVELLVRAVDAAGNEGQASGLVEVDDEPPGLVLDAVPPWTNAAAAVLVGKAMGAVRVGWRLEGAEPAAAPVHEGAFRIEVPLGAAGAHAIVLAAEDLAGNRSPEQRVLVQRHTEPPVVVWEAPDVDVVVAAGRTRVRVAVAGSVPVAEVRIGGQLAAAGDGGFAAEVEVAAAGETEVRVDATDAAGNRTPTLVRVLNRRWEAIATVTTGNGMVLHAIAPGTFELGPPERRVRVTLDRFWVARTEVTRAQWAALAPPLPAWGADWQQQAGLPATGMSWTEAVAWCARLDAAERARSPLPARHHVVLPTEAQWEAACRGGAATPWCHGDEPAQLGAFAVHEASALSPVAACRPNRFDLCDMHGNAAEWCHDVLDLAVAAGAHEPIGSSGALAAVRGGDHLSPARGVASHARRMLPVDRAEPTIGFRPVLCVRPARPAAK
jgi:formylglycine-generating enzyme required for sulfatase activity